MEARSTEFQSCHSILCLSKFWSLCRSCLSVLSAIQSFVILKTVEPKLACEFLAANLLPGWKVWLTHLETNDCDVLA